jgi:precorrin-3B synthase
MSTAASENKIEEFEIKGWCPGARRPMQSGDGLIARVRPHAGSLPVATLDHLADAAARFGNGQIDLTRRGNLQIRGIRPETLDPLWQALALLGLLDDSAELEAIRNIAINPLAGFDPAELIDMRPAARALETSLATMPELRGLPAKFGFLLDGGGRLPLSGLAADIHLVACRAGMVAVGLGADGGPVRWLGAVDVGHAASVAARLAGVVLARSATRRAQALSLETIGAIRSEFDLAPCSIPDGRGSRSQRCGFMTLGDGTYAVGLGVAFGRVDAGSLAALAGELTRLGVPEVRLSPWRTLYVAVGSRSQGEALLTLAQRIGLIIDDADPLVRIDACPGVGRCSVTTLATRDHARVLAGIAGRIGFAGTLHVSGCAKGCARSAPADVVLVGDGGRYRVVHGGTVKDEACAWLDPADIAARGGDLLRMERTDDV